MNRKKFVIIGICVVLLLGIGGYFGWRIAVTRYHRYQMTANYAAATKVGPNAPNYSELMHGYERHTKALMDCGYFVKQQFYLQKLKASSPGYRELLQKLSHRFPVSIGKIDPHGYIFGEPTFIIIWLNPEDAKAIEQFVQEHDVS